MFITIWKYQVAPHQLNSFREVYGQSGEWVRLFSRFPDYLSTELFQSCDTAGQFVTIDRWKSCASYTEFREQTRAEYAKMAPRCAELASKIQQVGQYVEAVD